MSALHDFDQNGCRKMCRKNKMLPPFLLGAFLCSFSIDFFKKGLIFKGFHGILY